MSSLMRRCTKEQHVEILESYSNDADAAEHYTEVMGKKVSRQNVTYWRKIFIENKGNRASLPAPGAQGFYSGQDLHRYLGWGDQ